MGRVGTVLGGDRHDASNRLKSQNGKLKDSSTLSAFLLYIVSVRFLFVLHYCSS